MCIVIDGGGVRGLSSLIILDKLMDFAIAYVRKEGHENRNLRPCQLFQLIAGTSTGGLISVMLGKLGLSPKECIYIYRNTTGEVFGNKKLRGRLTWGLWTSRYSGKALVRCVEKVLESKGYAKDLQFDGTDTPDGTAR